MTTRSPSIHAISCVRSYVCAKLEYTLRVPLTQLQRTWYHKCLAKDAGTAQLMSYSQMLAVMMQLQKICNHPKNMILQYDRDQALVAARVARAAGATLLGSICD